MDNEILKWIEYLEKDINAAKYLFDVSHPKLLEIICYHCQQCGEKAVIFSKQNNFGIPKSHDISFLLNQIKNVVKSMAPI